MDIWRKMAMLETIDIESSMARVETIEIWKNVGPETIDI
jgi:hypothetical protein